MERRLGLNDEQKLKFEELRSSHFEEITPIHDELKLKREALFSLNEEPLDNIQLQALFNEISALHLQTERLKFKHFKELNEVLNPEQRVQFERILKRAAGFGGHSKRFRKKRH